MDEEEYKNLNTKIWKTKGARFNAYRRNLNKSNILTYITTISSIHLVVLSIFQLSNIVTLTNQQSQWLSFVAVATAIIILAYGLVEGGKNHGVLAENYHLCGKEISKVYNKLQICFKNQNIEEIAKLSNEYDCILEKYTHNHAPIDYEYFQSEHPHEFLAYNQKKSLQKFIVWFMYKGIDFTLASLFILLPILCTFYVIFSSPCS